ncbi:MAG TPA: aminotransferase class IV [Miltoncostaeales bacterium]|nr:aminotransferase class IV [Miltoncostaeales bacterium]
MSERRAVMVNGTVYPDGEGIPIGLDDGLVRGDGVFEGMRFYDRVPRSPELHLDRLVRSGEGTEIPVDVPRLRREMRHFCEVTNSPNCGVRLMLTRGGHVIWREEPFAVFTDGEDLFPVANRVTPLLIGVKTLSYASNMRALRIAKTNGAHDALCYRADDRVILEGPTTAFGWLEGDTMVFPPLEIGVLDSITRRLAMEAVPAKTKEMPIDDLANVDGAFLMSSYQECVPVRSVSGIATFATDGAVRAMCDTVNAYLRTKVEQVTV